MNPKTVVGVLILVGWFISVLVYYGSQSNPFGASSKPVTRRTTWSYEPPIYLCKLVQIADQNTLKSAQDAGVLTNWLTVGGPPQPTTNNPNLLAHSGLGETWIDLEPGSTYFFDQCLGPFTDNMALCEAVKAQHLEGDAVNVQQNDCRIFIKIKR